MGDLAIGKMANLSNDDTNKHGRQLLHSRPFSAKPAEAKPNGCPSPRRLHSYLYGTDARRPRKRHRPFWRLLHMIVKLRGFHLLQLVRAGEGHWPC